MQQQNGETILGVGGSLDEKMEMRGGENTKRMVSFMSYRGEGRTEERGVVEILEP